MEIDNKQFDELKKILEPRQFPEVGTELLTQHFLDMDTIAFDMIYKELLNKEENTIPIKILLDKRIVMHKINNK